MNAQDGIYLYRCNGGADIYILSDKNMYANPDSSYSFYKMANLSQINFNNFTVDSRVTNMQQMFNAGGAYDSDKNTALKKLDLSGWDTSGVTTMYDMFAWLRGLTELDVSGWNTENVVNMNGVFGHCEIIEVLDLSSWNTRNVTSMTSMFHTCNRLTTIYASDDFVTTNVTYSLYMFKQVLVGKFLTGGAGTKYTDSNPSDKTYARIDDPKNGKPGYFTRKE